MADSSTAARVEALRKAAVDRGIDLPKAKKKSSREVEEALETAGLEDETGGSGDNEALKKAALKILAKKFGVKKEQQKATGKRKADGGKGAAKPAAPSSSALDEVWDVSTKEERKKYVAKLIEIAKARGVRIPEDAQAASMGVGTVIMGSKDADNKLKVKDAVEELTDKFGKDPAWVDPEDSGPKKKKRPSTAKQCTCPENKALADAFDELAGLYFKEGSKAGGVYKKVVSAIKDMPKPLTTAPKKGEVPGIGAKTIQKINEFLATGKIQTLEDKRAESVM
ncbi:conserved unknown protein [Ectocarpus siliculosus]|uniref:Crossover junction endonuclease MUS81-like HHH domain-containing protein n=1 Tax=Ectocarpus siliculosus TaxID=2880 RepID=D7G694_ECTSI|nr:conserved unknown protein [Ectocarpus siliculosus]|eukprot:CBJ27489.1 conserved unknown protein [Ectocarpus siliculosus]